MSLNEGEPVNVVSVKALSEYRLKVTFDDGHVSTVDFGAFLRNAHQSGIQKYLEPSQFKSVSILYGNLVWGDYDMCFPLEDLYRGDVMPHAESSRLHAVAESRAKYGGG